MSGALDVTAPWQVLEREQLLLRPRMTVVRETVRLPDGRIISDYDVIEMGRASVIAASRPDGSVILLRTYKHGARRGGLGFPGGGVEPDESDLAAAQRELREETGYVSSHWQALGDYPVHTNQGCGHIAYFAAFDCQQLAEVIVDDLEAHEFVYATRADIQAAVANGSFLALGHVALAALWLALARPPAQTGV